MASYEINTSRGKVRFRSVGEPIIEQPAFHVSAVLIRCDWRVTSNSSRRVRPCNYEPHISDYMLICEKHLRFSPDSHY